MINRHLLYMVEIGGSEWPKWGQYIWVESIPCPRTSFFTSLGDTNFYDPALVGCMKSSPKLYRTLPSLTPRSRATWQLFSPFSFNTWIVTTSSLRRCFGIGGSRLAYLMPESIPFQASTTPLRRVVNPRVPLDLSYHVPRHNRTKTNW